VVTAERFVKIGEAAGIINEAGTEAKLTNKTA
jgi:hypothetical protein